MQSINPEINAMHAAFCEALGHNIPQMPRHERGWNDALHWGMTPDCVKLVIKARQARIKAGVRHPECLLFKNVAGTDEAIADVIEEAAAIRAKMRVKVYSAGKAEVLRATGRPDAPEQGKTMPFSEVIKGLRKAAE